jgi:DNA segregation ATPase FtsK/SpoIIIE, S-DNA-T family
LSEPAPSSDEVHRRADAALQQYWAVRRSIPAVHARLSRERTALEASARIDADTARAAIKFGELQRRQSAEIVDSNHPTVDGALATVVDAYRRVMSQVPSRGAAILTESAAQADANNIDDHDPDLLSLRSAGDFVQPITEMLSRLAEISRLIAAIPPRDAALLGRRARAERTAAYAAEAQRVLALTHALIRVLRHELGVERAAALDPSAREIQFETLASTEIPQRLELARQEHAEAVRRAEEQIRGEIAAVVSDWRETARQLEALSPSWSSPAWSAWAPSEAIRPNVRVGLYDGLLGSTALRMPCVWSFPANRSLAILVDTASRSQGLANTQSVALRILASVPAGKVRFTFCDPIERAGTFAPFAHLRERAPTIFGDAIRCEPADIEQALKDLSAHIDRVQQDYLRGEHEDLESYNRSVGDVPEAYRVLVYADCPEGLTSQTLERLSTIVTSGAQCGVYVVLLIDTSRPVPHGFDFSRMLASTFVVDATSASNQSRASHTRRTPILLDDPPELRMTATNSPFGRIVAAVADGSSTAGTVHTPFPKALSLFMSKVKASANAFPGIDGGFELSRLDTWWKSTSIDGLHAPIGRLGANDLQVLSLGGQNMHTLVVGQTRSGKTNMIYVLLSALCTLYGPKELGIYLIDFKEGADFATWSDPRHVLPHLVATGIFADREFGLAMLEMVERERKRRVSLFTSEAQRRSASIEKIERYRAVTGQPMRRLLVIVDEFQMLLAGQDAVSERAKQTAETLARLGSSAGIHLLFATQTLNGLSGLRAIFSQFANRIAYKCDAADAAMLFGERNTEPRLIERQGEAVYNDRNGEPQFNRRYQTSFLAEQLEGEKRLASAGPTKEELSRALAAKAEHTASSSEATVYDGRRFLLIESRLKDLAESPMPVIAIGDSPALSDPIDIRLTRRNSNHMLMVGGAPAFRHASVQNVIASFRFTAPFGRLVVADFTPEDLFTPSSGDAPVNRRDLMFTPTATGDLPVEILTQLSEVADAADAEYIAPHLSIAILAEIAAEVDRRSKSRFVGGEPTLIVLNGLEYATELRRDPNASFARPREIDPPDASASLSTLLLDGAANGFFVLVSAEDTVAFERVFDRRQVESFGHRIVFTVSEADSRALLGDASATTLRPGRGVLVVTQGNRRTPFRPYVPLSARSLDGATRARRATHTSDTQLPRDDA